MPGSDGSSITWFDPKDGVPFPDDQIPWYNQYIEAVCIDPKAKADALAALAARDQARLDAILRAQPEQPEEQMLARFRAAADKAATALTEDQEEQMLRDLGYDV